MIEPVTNVDEIIAAQELVREIKIKELLMKYIVDLVRATRDPSSGCGIAEPLMSEDAALIALAAASWRTPC